jgi:hypothetical protein
MKYLRMFFFPKHFINIIFSGKKTMTKEKVIHAILQQNKLKKLVLMKDLMIKKLKEILSQQKGVFRSLPPNKQNNMFYYN